jgi:hypothetical protein
LRLVRTRPFLLTKSRMPADFYEGKTNV